MKIDIHTHTKKCKSGDAPTREISPIEFCGKILSTQVRIAAITNHNIFDLVQFEEIVARLNGEAQVWPGIELDILDGGSRGHLLVITSPRSSKQFAEAVTQLTKGSTPDSFSATIDDVLRAFDTMEPLYIAHYKQKKPNISDELLEQLETRVRNPWCVIKEVTNSISAGIYISHGHPSIYGSDVHDWGKYEMQSELLPDLRLPVESFEHFCLLLKKDQTTINTLLDRKTSEEITIRPFEDDSTISINAYNDITVIFGPKGTGKSCILRAIAKHYSDNGVDATVYESLTDRLDEIFDTKGRNLAVNLNSHEINYCTDEIDLIKNSIEADVTSLSKYVTYFRANRTNRNAKLILLKDLNPEDESSAKRQFSNVHDAENETNRFLEFLRASEIAKSELIEAEYNDLLQMVSALLHRLNKRAWESFAEWKKIWMLNSAISVFRREVERKTGNPAKPVKTGFKDYAVNRIQIALSAAEVMKSVGSKIPPHTDTIGSLGANKGYLQCIMEIVFQNGAITDGSLNSLTSTKKSAQKRFIQNINDILESSFGDDLFKYISELNGIEDADDIKTVNELLMFKRYFALDGKPYTPSSGESSMIILQKELSKEKDVYILDEPEKSLGNEYINDVIVPLINEKARIGRKIFISTHDANIAVRTLPYSSVYRCHDRSGYKTYMGNPFSNNLINPSDSGDFLDWKKTSMKTLEGGEEAFGERGKIYGNN